MFEAIWEFAKPYLVGTIKGFGAGVVASGMGYLKNKGEEFDGKKFTRTVIVGGVTGALAEGFGVSPETTDEYLAYPFVIYAIDVVTKIVYRRAVKPLIDEVRAFIKKETE